MGPWGEGDPKTDGNGMIKPNIFTGPTGMGIGRPNWTRVGIKFVPGIKDQNPDTPNQEDRYIVTDKYNVGMGDVDTLKPGGVRTGQTASAQDMALAQQHIDNYYVQKNIKDEHEATYDRITFAADRLAGQGDMTYEEFSEQFPIEVLYDSYNTLVDRSRSANPDEVNRGSSVVSDSVFAVRIINDIKIGHEASFGIKAAEGRQTLYPVAVDDWNVLLVSDWGRKNLMPGDMGPESQAVYTKIKQIFEERKNDVIDGGRDNKMSADELSTFKSQIEFLNKNEFSRENLRRSGGDRMTKLVRDKFNARVDASMSGRAKREEPAGRREDDIREALIRKVVQEALKRNFGE